MDLSSAKPWKDLDNLEDVTDIEFIQAVMYLKADTAQNREKVSMVTAETIKQGKIEWNVNLNKLMKQFNVKDKKELVYVAVAKKMKEKIGKDDEKTLINELASIKDSTVRETLIEFLKVEKVNVDMTKLSAAVKRRSSPGPAFRR